MKTTVALSKMFLKMGVLNFLFFSFLSPAVAEHSTTSVDLSTTPSCDRYSTETEPQGKLIENMSDFKSNILVARKIFSVIDDNESKSRIYSVTILSKNRQTTKIHCLSGAIPIGKRYSETVPLILDLTEKNQIGNSFWELQVYRNPLGLFTRSQKSIQNQDKFLNYLRHEFSEVHFREIQDDFIQLQLIKKTRNFQQMITIEFDVLKP